MAHSLRIPKFRAFDANGAPLAGGKLYSYEAGTTTPQDTYTDKGGGTSNANPVILDANGEADVWLADGTNYKFVLKDSSDNTQWTEDNVQMMNDGSISTAMIADSAITTAKIDDGAVTLAKTSVSDYAFASKTADYTAATSDDFLRCDSSGGAFTVTLYSVLGNNGKTLTIKKTDSSFVALTIAAASTEYIDGLSSIKLCTVGEQVTLKTDGLTWHIVSHSYYSGSTSFTPTLSWTTNTTATGQWSRSGNLWNIHISISLSGAPDSASLTLSPPTGASWDTTFAGSSTTANCPIGRFLYYDSSATQTYYGFCGISGVSTKYFYLYPFISITGSNPVNIAQGTILSYNSPVTSASGDIVQISASIPMTNWF